MLVDLTRRELLILRHSLDDHIVVVQQAVKALDDVRFTNAIDQYVGEALALRAEVVTALQRTSIFSDEGMAERKRQQAADPEAPTYSSPAEARHERLLWGGPEAA